MLPETETTEVVQQRVAPPQQVRGVLLGARIGEDERVFRLEIDEPSQRIVAMALQAVQRPFSQAEHIGKHFRLGMQAVGQCQRGIRRLGGHLGQQLNQLGDLQLSARGIQQTRQGQAQRIVRRGVDGTQRREPPRGECAVCGGRGLGGSHERGPNCASTKPARASCMS